MKNISRCPSVQLLSIQIRGVYFQNKMRNFDFYLRNCCQAFKVVILDIYMIIIYQMTM